MNMKDNSKYFSPILVAAVIILFVGALNAHAFTDIFDDMQVIKISPQDEWAIVKTKAGEKMVIKAGGPVGDNGEVIEITEGRVVIEQRTERNIETIIIRDENGKQKVERIKRVGDRQPILYVPR